MTYVYPYRIPVTATTASFANQVVTASSAASGFVGAAAAFFAVAVQTAGPQGPSGSSPTCPLDPQGPSGSIGPSGSRGPDLVSCPPGSVLCPHRTPPSGYSLVCIQIPDGCPSAQVFCGNGTTTTTTTTTAACLPQDDPCIENFDCCSNNCFEGFCGPEL